jgi:hypothetical protein
LSSFRYTLSIDISILSWRNENVTLVDRAIPLYVWFAAAFGPMAMVIGAMNFGMIVVLTLTQVFGITLPSWAIPALAVGTIAYAIIQGYVMEKYDVMNRILDHQNKRQNPQMKQISEDVVAIKKMLEER